MIHKKFSFNPTFTNCTNIKSPLSIQQVELKTKLTWQLSRGSALRDLCQTAVLASRLSLFPSDMAVPADVLELDLQTV